MKIAGMVKSSLVDYPGMVSCVLFVPGCNYNCFYCHNRPLIDGTHEIISPDYVRRFLESRVGLLDAVVITGGEPTLHPELLPLLRELKLMGYKLKLDTNGSSPEVVAEVLKQGLCSYFAVDYKAPTGQYPMIAGKRAAGETVLETIRLLKNSGVDFEVRTTVYPQLSRDELLQMAKDLPLVPRYVLNRYRKPEKHLPGDEARVSQTPYTQREIVEIAKELRQYQPNVIV